MVNGTYNSSTGATKTGQSIVLNCQFSVQSYAISCLWLVLEFEAMGGGRLPTLPSMALFDKISGVQEEISFVLYCLL